MSETITKPKRTRKKKDEVVVTETIVNQVIPNESDPKKYHIEIAINDKHFSLDTDDVRSAILSTEPEFLRTKVVIKITHNGKTLDRLLYLRQAKNLFINRFAMDAFIKNLLF